MSTVNLSEYAVITLNGAGAGTARLGPLSAREIWHVVNVSVSANKNPTNESTCQVFAGETATQPYFSDGCVDGSSGDSTDKAAGDLKVGQYIWAVWTGGDAGVQAVVKVTGTKDI